MTGIWDRMQKFLVPGSEFSHPSGQFNAFQIQGKERLSL